MSGQVARPKPALIAIRDHYRAEARRLQRARERPAGIHGGCFHE